MLFIEFLCKILAEILVAIYFWSTSGFLFKNTCKMALRRET